MYYFIKIGTNDSGVGESAKTHSSTPGTFDITESFREVIIMIKL